MEERLALQVPLQKETNLVARMSRHLVPLVHLILGCTLMVVASAGGLGCAKVASQQTGTAGAGGTLSGVAGGGAAGTTGSAGDDGGAGTFSVFTGDAMQQSAVCGNSIKEPGENCDDGNAVSNDGCSSICLREADYTCPVDGKPCVHDTICGDHMIEAMEACDDGNKISGDGCSADCMLVECGYECPSGSNCRAAKCGDGKVAGQEQCDDGNVADGDGCSKDCTLESKPVGVAEGWICTSPPGAMGCKGPTTCTTTTCGNKMVEGSEQCDDGNKLTGDGCSPFCRLEPICPPAGGACKTACGDGLILPIDTDQECDDGNTVDGDGCSHDCKQEDGFVCDDVSTKPDKLVLPVIYHDFKGWGEGDAAHDHPDFFHFPGNGKGFPGIVQAALGPAGVPLHVAGCFPMPGAGYPAILTANNCASGGVPAPTGPAWDATVDWFGMWYLDNATYNKTIVSTLTLPSIGNGAFQFSADSNTAPDFGFFPLNGLGWATGATGRNYGFTSVVRTWFEYTGTANLAFYGDDDVWVFINKKLAVDLGGTHQQATGSVTLDAANGHGYVCDFVAPGNAYPSPACTATSSAVGDGHDVDLGLKVGSVYEIAVFQAERYPSESNYRLTLGGFTGKKSKCVGACGDGFQTGSEKCDLGKTKNTGAYGGCNADCTLAPYCGDKMVTAPEQCDGTPGCGADCKVIVVQ